MGLKNMVVKLLVRKLAPKILGRFAPRLMGSLAPRLMGSLAPRLMGSLAPRLMGKLDGRYGYAKYGYKPKSRGLLGGLNKLLRKLT
jgi:hypothetical protein